MAAVKGISMDILEASELTVVTVSRDFSYHTAAVIRPILVIHRSHLSSVSRCSMSLRFYKWTGNPIKSIYDSDYVLNSHLKSKNYGMAGAAIFVRVYLFIGSCILCMIVYKMTKMTQTRTI